jgi:hypothetical protein
MSPEGEYRVRYEPDVGEFGRLLVTSIGDEDLVWLPYICEPRDGCVELGGISHGTQAAWGDTYWFSLFVGRVSRIEYWGNQVLIREHQAVAPSSNATTI